MKGFHFPSTRTTKSIRLILGSQYSLYENYIGYRNDRFFSHTNPYILNVTQQCRCSPMLIFRACATCDHTSPSALRAETSSRYQSDTPEKPNLTHRRSGCQLSLLSINFDFRNVIFQPMVFPFVWANYQWNFMRDRCKLSFPLPPRGFAARSRVLARLASLAQIGELARRLLCRWHATVYRVYIRNWFGGDRCYNFHGIMYCWYQSMGAFG